MRNTIHSMQRQGGAVAIIVGLSIFVLVVMLGLVLDLGQLYITKTELQNAADAAALAGAKDLDGTADGIDRAESQAISTADANSVRFGANAGAVVIASANIEYGPSPSGPWSVYAAARAAPAELSFLKVDTSDPPILQGSLRTWFIQVLPGVSPDMTTFGMAVAGRYITPITPLGVCALRPARETWVNYGAGADRYKVEFGFIRGVSYDLQRINDTLSGLASGTALYVHPTATSQTDCQESHGSADFAAPFLCTGRSAISGRTGSTVYTNTGLAAGKSIAALNTRFGQYGPPLDSSLNSTVCPPDANIREYTPSVANNWMTSTQPPIDQMAIFGLADWLAGVGDTRTPQPPPSLVNERENQGGCMQTGAGGGADCSDNYGVLWSYTRPLRESGSFAPADWPALYPQGPTSSAYVEPSPYWYGLANQGNPTYFLAPSPAVSQSPNPRRVLNVVIVQCPAPSGGICRPIPVIGTARFFMQRTATQAGWIAGEFAGLVPEAELSQDIRLYD